jgi:hypothetical protein
MIELIAGTCPHDPPIRVLAIPAATMLFAIGVELLLVDALRIAGIRAPCRISSLPVGAPLRPGIYAYIEDICAVDGSGGTEFRQRLNLRYQASKAFREMLHRLTLFWAIGAIVCSVVTVAIVFTIQRDAAYVVSSMYRSSSTSMLTISGRLGTSIPLGWRMDRHYHSLGAEELGSRVQRMDRSKVQGLVPFASRCICFLFQCNTIVTESLKIVMAL